MSETPITWNQTVQAVSEFLEVAIHTILYVRGVYPADLFVRRKKYDTPVWQSRHPALNQYVAGAVRAIRAEVLLGKVDKVVLVIKDRADVALERFVFSIRTMLDIEPYQKDDPIDDAMPPSQLGLHFRGFLTKLSFLDGVLAPLLPLAPDNDDLSFAIVLELDEGAVPTASAPTGKADPPPWTPASRSHTTAGASADAPTHVVRAVDTGVINVGLVVQESVEKLARRRDPPPPPASAESGRTQDKGKGKETAQARTTQDDEDDDLYGEGPVPPPPAQRHVSRTRLPEADDSMDMDERPFTLDLSPGTPAQPLTPTQRLTPTQPRAESQPSRPWTQPVASQEAAAYGSRTIYDD